MNFPSPVTALWLADFINAKISGDANASATGINELHRVRKGDIVFVDHPKYYNTCLKSDATFIIINKETDVPEGKTLLISDNPFEAYQKIVSHFRPFTPSHQMISSTSEIDPTAVIMPGVFIGNQVKIGREVIIHPNVTIYDNVTIKDHVEIHSGSVIGGNAFYYNGKKDRDVWYQLMNSCGEVIIESHVDIGSNCTIDRGVSDVTRIGEGTKIDNLVHIGHDVIIGRNCLIAAQCGIAGGTVLGIGVILWGQVGVNKTISIGDNAMVMAQSGVANSLEGNKSYFGSPAEEYYSKRKEILLARRLPEIWEKVRGK